MEEAEILGTRYAKSVKRCWVQVALTGLLLSAAAWPGPLRGWELSSPNPQSYGFSQDTATVHGGRASGILKSLESTDNRHYAVVGQCIQATHYLRRRVRLTGYLRTQEVQGRAGLWLRVDPWSGPPLEFDNMEKRPIRGTTPWTAYDLELDVPENAYYLHFGVLLQGSGQVWLDDLSLVGIGESLPATRARKKLRREPPPPLEPLNLGLED